MKKSKPDVYTILLILSLCAILVGCGFLLAELAQYDYKITSYRGMVHPAAEQAPAFASLPAAPGSWHA